VDSWVLVVINNDASQEGPHKYRDPRPIMKTVRGNRTDWPVLLDAERIFIWTESAGMRICFLVREDLLE